MVALTVNTSGWGLTVSTFGNHGMLYKHLVYQHQGDQVYGNLADG